MRFKKYLLNEQKEYFGEKVNDVLTGVHELLQAKKQMGAKHLIRNAELIANQIRKILHTSWSRSEHKYLKVLQKCGVALMKAIDDKGDLPETFNNVRSELEAMSHKVGVPANKLGTTTEKEARPRPEPAPNEPKQQTEPQMQQQAPSGPQPPDMSSTMMNQ